MAKHTDGIEMFYAENSEAWRNWLQANSQTEKAVWLIYYKPASGKTRVSYNDAVDEAICFDWIEFLIIYQFYHFLNAGMYLRTC